MASDSYQEEMLVAVEACIECSSAHPNHSCDGLAPLGTLSAEEGMSYLPIPSISMCVQVWVQWTAHYEARQVESGQLASAARHWGLRLKQAVVRAWWDYVESRRRKLYLKRVAIGAHDSTIMLISYSHWKMQFLMNKKMAQFEDLIVHKSKLSILRRILVRWKLCILCDHTHMMTTPTCVHSYGGTSVIHSSFSGSP